jgi:hypothetical protein
MLSDVDREARLPAAWRAKPTWRYVAAPPGTSPVGARFMTHWHGEQFADDEYAEIGRVKSFRHDS